jgi:signal transduction histidine kinase
MTSGEQHERAPLILVADDEPANVALLFEQLQALGLRTVGAHDGPSAWTACLSERPDLCILDVGMPAGSLGVDDRTTGFELCRRIKRDARTSRIPVIFVTALNDTSDRLRAIECGADDFLSKPHNQLVLGARVRSLLKLKAATDALEQSLRKLREFEKLRDDLMKMIVHDLKTPLTAVLATLEMVLDGDFGGVTEQQRKALNEAEGHSEELLGLIEDLLEVARIEESAPALQPVRIAPGAFLAELVHEWGPRFRQEGVQVTVDVTDDAPVFEGDKQLLKRLFSNLVQNAVTHCSYAVEIRLSARRDGDGVLVTVADNGPGIPREYHEVIFGKFQQVKSPSMPRVRSSGLGLAFCKLVAEAHHGRIWVQSEEGQGSAFHVSLPSRAPADALVGGQAG